MELTERHRLFLQERLLSRVVVHRRLSKRTLHNLTDMAAPSHWFFVAWSRTLLCLSDMVARKLLCLSDMVACNLLCLFDAVARKLSCLSGTGGRETLE